jgi:hypothetical protein
MTINAMRPAHNAKVLLSERRVPLSGHSFAVIVQPSHVPPRPAFGLKRQDNDLIVIERAEAVAAFKRTCDMRPASFCRLARRSGLSPFLLQIESFDASCVETVSIASATLQQGINRIGDFFEFGCE